MLIGAMTVVETSNLITDDESSSDDDEDELLEGDIDANSPTINDDVDLDAIFIAGVNASRPGNTDAQHLLAHQLQRCQKDTGCHITAQY